MKKWFLGIVVLIFLFSCNLDQVRDQEVNLQVDYLTYLEINPGGLEVRIIGEPSLGETTIKAKLVRENEFSPLLRVNRQFGRIVLDLDNIRNNVNPISGYIEIRTPGNLELKVAGGSHKISIRDLETKTVQIDHKSGEIALQNIRTNELLVMQNAGIFSASLIESSDFFLNLLGGTGTLQNFKGKMGVFTEGGRITVQDVETMSLAAANSPGGLLLIKNVGMLQAASAGRGEVKGEHVGLADRVELNAAGGKVTIQTTDDLSNYGILFNMSPGSVRVAERVYNSSISNFLDGQPLLFGTLYGGSVTLTN